MTCVGLWPNNANVEDPTVTVKSKTAPKPMFLIMNLPEEGYYRSPIF
jgi:hypothetical protein